MEDVNIANPNDISYAYNGYAPMSIRFIEKLFKAGWSFPECIFLYTFNVKS